MGRTYYIVCESHLMHLVTEDRGEADRAAALLQAEHDKVTASRGPYAARRWWHVHQAVELTRDAVEGLARRIRDGSE